MDELVQNLAVILGKCVITYNVEPEFDGDYQIWISGEDYSRTKEIHNFLANNVRKPLVKRHSTVKCGIYPQWIIDYMVNDTTKMQKRTDIKQTKRKRNIKDTESYEDIYRTIYRDSPAVPYTAVSNEQTQTDYSLDETINNRLMSDDYNGKLSPDIVRDWICCLLLRKNEYKNFNYRNWEGTMLRDYFDNKAWTFVKTIIHEFPDLTRYIYEADLDVLLEQVCKSGELDIVKYLIDYVGASLSDYTLYKTITAYCKETQRRTQIKTVVEYLLSQSRVNVSDNNNKIIQILNYHGVSQMSELRMLIIRHPTYNPDIDAKIDVEDVGGYDSDRGGTCYPGCDGSCLY